MKTVIAVFVFVLCVGIYADDPAPQAGGVVATTLFSDGSTNVWTQADLLAALQLINRKYHRDCETGSGRAAWHGRTEYHDDGQTFTFTSRVVSAAVAVSNANSRLSTTMTRGVPRELAKARMRRAQEKSVVSNVTVSVEANVR